MTLPTSDLFTVKTIADAGRGVVALKSIPKNTSVLRSQSPAAHVIFYQYRKEVCAQCFLYDRGRRLPIRLDPAGKVFCSPECESLWLEDHQALGQTAWEQLQVFLQAKSKAITNASGLPLLAPKPGREDILSKWQSAEDIAKPLRDRRSKSFREENDKKQVSPFQHFSTKPWCQTVDPDVLGYLLSGILFHFMHPEKYHSDVLPLAMDETPYRSTFDLNAHVNSYLQLTAIAPTDLLPRITPEVCQTLIEAAGHNSFGIRSGSADGEEYLGYALYPEASYFNHSCSPNIAKTRVGNVWEFSTSRDIDVGEECCITYLGGDEDELNVEQRRQRLREHWGFKCMCARCKEESRS